MYCVSKAHRADLREKHRCEGDAHVVTEVLGLPGIVEKRNNIGSSTEP